MNTYSLKVWCDGLWQEGFPVAIRVTAELNEPLGEGTLLSVQYVIERVVRIIHDG